MHVHKTDFARFILTMAIWVSSTQAHAGSWSYWERIVSSESKFMTADGCNYIGGIYPISDDTIYVVQCGDNTAPITVDTSGNRLSLFAATALGEGGTITATGRDRNYAYIAITDNNGVARVESSAGTRWDLARFNSMIVTGFSDRMAVGYSEVSANKVDPLVSRLPLRVLAYSPPEIIALGSIVKTMSVDQSTRVQAALVRKSRLSVPTLGVYEFAANGIPYARIIAGTEGTIDKSIKAGIVDGETVVGFEKRQGRNRSTWLYRNRRLESITAFDIVNVDGVIVLRDRKKVCSVLAGTEIMPLWAARPCLEAKVDDSGRLHIVVQDGDHFANRRYRLQRTSTVLVDEFLADCTQSTRTCIELASRRFGRPTALFKILNARGIATADAADRYLSNTALQKINWRASLAILKRDGKRRGLLARLGKIRSSEALLEVHRWATNRRLSEAKKQAKIRQIAGKGKWRGLLKPADAVRWGKLIKKFNS